MSPKKEPDPTKVAIAWQDPVMMQVGKGGLSEGIFAEGKRLLKKHKYMKVRLLRSTGGDKHSKHGIFEEFCAKIGGKVAGVRGNTAVIYKPKK